MQVNPRKGGGSREAGAAEALKLIIGALAAAKWAGGVKYLNAQTPDGKSLAVAVIPGVRFSEMPDGRTALGQVIDNLPAR